MSAVSLIPGCVLSPVAADAPITTPHRVLYIDAKYNIAVLIPVEPNRYAARLYFRGYSTFNLSILMTAIDADVPTLCVVELMPRLTTMLSDEELDRKFRRKNQSRSSALIQLEQRWQLIEPLITLHPSILFNKRSLLSAIKSEANQHCSSQEDIERTVTRTLQYLHQYWAGGSLRHALLSFWDSCGGRGKHHRASGKKLGRPNRPTESGVEKVEGFICDGKDIDLIQFCWRNFVIRDHTVAWACRKMWREFYSDFVTQDDGKVVQSLLPVNKRPTITQFRYWGALQSPGSEAWIKQLVNKGFERNWRALPGSSNDDVVAVGQRAAVDSTPPDLELVSILSRLRPIGGAYRIIIVDSMFGYIPGFYLGINPPSSETVKLAFLHAMSDKRQWLEDLGLDIPAENWLPIAFTHAIADNTDLRTETVKNALHSIGTSITFVPTYRSDLNSQAESAHHALHRTVDHNLMGSTHGRKAERGEARAVFNARLTIFEAIRETARAVHAHNTMELDIVKPLAMREANIKPTRLDMTRWAISTGKIARTGMDIQSARMKLLPLTRGCFTASGVKLLRWDTGNKREFLEPLRYVSKHPWVMQKMEMARRGGKHQSNAFDVDVRYDPFSIRCIYIYDAEQYGMLQLDLKIDDPDLASEASIYDVADIEKHDDVGNFYAADQRDLVRSGIEASQEDTNAEAEKAYKAELSHLDAKPTKTEMLEHKRENREAEENILRNGLPWVVNAKVLTDIKSNDEPVSPESANTPVESIVESSDKQDVLSDVIRKHCENKDG